MISIIIPSLNEEKYLPRLLESIRQQIFDEKYETIVADAGSEDKTAIIAADFGCKITDGGDLPAKGKNSGVKIATGDIILFADADTVLPADFLEKATKEFRQRNLGVASFYIKPNDKKYNFLYKILFNIPSRITEKFFPQAMNVIMIKKDIHEKIGGFNGAIRLGEELDYIRRGEKIGRFGVISSVVPYISARRFERDGWIKTWSKYFLCQLYMIFFGPVTSDIFKYKFNHYSQERKN
ncbi:MAG: glycosyltransferase [Patescibacteria group bacterium]